MKHTNTTTTAATPHDEKSWLCHPTRIVRKQMSNHALVSTEMDPKSTPSFVEITGPSEFDEAFAEQYISYIRKRLLARYACTFPEHKFCFDTPAGRHVPLDNKDIDIWTSACLRCEATLFYPPGGLILNIGFDTTSVQTTPSSTTMKIPSHSDRSIKDLLSIKDNLSAKSASLSLKTSIFPGPGYLYGKLLEKLGLRVVAILIRLDIARRMFLIGRLARNIERGSFEARSKYLSNHTRNIIRASEDLLELFDPRYSSSLRKSAKRLATLIISSTNGLPTTFTNAMARLNLLPLELSLQRLPSSEVIIRDLREILLQERNWDDDPQITCVEAIQFIIGELLYASLSESWRFYGYSTLWSFAETQVGLDVIESLQRRGGVATLFSQRYHTSPPKDHRARICALGFIVRVADRVHIVQPFAAKSSGVPFVLEQIIGLLEQFKANIKPNDSDIGDTISTIRRWYRLLDMVSSYTWGVGILMQCDIAAFLKKVHHASIGVHLDHHGSLHSLDIARMAYSQLTVLRNIAIIGSVAGRTAVDRMLNGAENVLNCLVGQIEAGNLGSVYVRRTYELAREVKKGFII